MFLYPPKYNPLLQSYNLKLRYGNKHDLHINTLRWHRNGRGEREKCQYIYKCPNIGTRQEIYLTTTVRISVKGHMAIGGIYNPLLLPYIPFSTFPQQVPKPVHFFFSVW